HYKTAAPPASPLHRLSPLSLSLSLSLSNLEEFQKLPTFGGEMSSSQGGGGRGKAKTTKAVSRSSKAGLQFPVGRIARYLKAGKCWSWPGTRRGTTRRTGSCRGTSSWRCATTRS
ncbi:hypothetical protein EE612_020113, partial [Oryza sativa]